jgi:hypothetical protein
MHLLPLPQRMCSTRGAATKQQMSVDAAHQAQLPSTASETASQNIRCSKLAAHCLSSQEDLACWQHERPAAAASCSFLKFVIAAAAAASAMPLAGTMRLPSCLTWKQSSES